jgi:hypothetical protein
MKGISRRCLVVGGGEGGRDRWRWVGRAVPSPPREVWRCRVRVGISVAHHPAAAAGDQPTLPRGGWRTGFLGRALCADGGGGWRWVGRAVPARRVRCGGVE